MPGSTREKDTTVHSGDHMLNRIIFMYICQKNLKQDGGPYLIEAYGTLYVHTVAALHGHKFSIFLVTLSL